VGSAWTLENPRHIIGKVRLQTRRLELRPFGPADVEAFETFARTEAYRRFLGDGHPDPPEFVANNLGKDGAWVIEIDQRVVGSVFLDDELAFLVDPSMHRMGIATEAARAVIADGFERRGYDHVVARANPRNIASVRTLARLGFLAGNDGTYRLDRTDWEPP